VGEQGLIRLFVPQREAPLSYLVAMVVALPVLK